MQDDQRLASTVLKRQGRIALFDVGIATVMCIETRESLPEFRYVYLRIDQMQIFQLSYGIYIPRSFF